MKGKENSTITREKKNLTKSDKKESDKVVLCQEVTKWKPSHDLFPYEVTEDACHQISGQTGHVSIIKDTKKWKHLIERLSYANHTANNNNDTVIEKGYWFCKPTYYTDHALKERPNKVQKT